MLCHGSLMPGAVMPVKTGFQPKVTVMPVKTGIQSSRLDSGPGLEPSGACLPTPE
jgi:hypothetical protein